MSESLRQLIERVLSTNLLTRELVDISKAAVTNAELDSAPHLPNSLCDLLAWHNGFDLEVVRIHGVGNVFQQIQLVSSGEILFASDPAGFTYALRNDGSVTSTDHDGGEVKIVAQSVDDFFREYIFGSRASEFSGEDWAQEVKLAIGNG